MVSLVFTKSQGLVGSFVNFNHFLFGDLAFHGPFPRSPFGLPYLLGRSHFKDLFTCTPLQGHLHLVFKSPFSSFFHCQALAPFYLVPLLFCKSISMSHGPFISMQGPWSISLGQISSFNFLGINKVFISIASKVLNIKIVQHIT